MRLAGLIALQDPPRRDSAALVESLRQLGVRVAMVTSDSQAAAQRVAKTVGIGDAYLPGTSVEGKCRAGDRFLAIPSKFAGMFMLSLAYLILMDFLKLRIFRHFGLTH